MLWWVFVGVSLIAMPVVGEEETPVPSSPGLIAEQAVICTGVADRSPVGAAELFEAGIGKLWCFTRIAGVEEETTVTHVWYVGEQKVHEQALAVRGPAWRTWSNKTIPPDWTGPWHVDVVAPGGVVLKTLSFTVE